MTSGTVSSLFVLFLSCTNVLAQTVNTQSVQYNQVLNVNGDMALNSFQFPDRSKVETFSQKQQQIIVNQQTPSIPSNQVTGTTGQPFVAVSPQSMTISTNGATDLVGGQIEMAMTMQNLQGVAVQPGNTYVAMLSPDRQSWMIQETMRSVNTTDMTVRMVKRTQMDGEYMVVGRQTVETNTLVVPFGSDGSTSVAIQGTGLQENEFQDGFRMATRATQPMTMNVNVKKGVDQGMLAALQGQSSINDYRYSVVTNLAAVTPNLNQQVTVVQMPVNAIRIQKMMQAMNVPANGQVAIAVAQRGVLQNPGGATGNLNSAGTRRSVYGRSEFREKIAARQVQGTGTTNTNTGTSTTGNNPNPVAQQLLLAPTFTPIAATAVLDQANMRIAIPVKQVDGEYILTMTLMSGGAQAAAAPQAAPQAASPAAGTAASPATPQTSSSATKGEKPALEGTNSTMSAKPEAPKAEAAKKAERREDSKTDKYGLPIAPQGAVIMTMKQIDDMASAMTWGGGVPITKMMSEYVKAQTGTDLFGSSSAPAAASADGGLKISV
ncbi:paired amphipathic helix sin3a [Pyrenophora seminiperda CCB06]|uniref:Paired amphipathic helix sin3a n=1 Tax=Pyrenophora seminiperda CCB06 TaxID=1302712 RepID=A0A3M7M7S0_9PLEO|nr:paired amphipathic helix sin3a [Pyrenophora seminiperda CCB06]